MTSPAVRKDTRWRLKSSIANGLTCLINFKKKKKNQISESFFSVLNCIHKWNESDAQYLIFEDSDPEPASSTSDSSYSSSSSANGKSCFKIPLDDLERVDDVTKSRNDVTAWTSPSEGSGEKGIRLIRLDQNCREMESEVTKSRSRSRRWTWTEEFLLTLKGTLRC